MKKARRKKQVDELRPEYQRSDFGELVRGKYASQLAEGSTASTKTAFVIMPFDLELEEVYGNFISPTLRDAGFVVRRADDLFNQQNILRDIVESISHSDLIIADLTNLNPNVFYELGVAHALGRPVILLTQNIDEVPFDLKSYRLVAYETHFARIERARETLLATAKGAFSGALEFGNPVSDFLGDVGSSSVTPAAPNGSARTIGEAPGATSGEEEERGWLDHLDSLESGFATLNGITREIATATTQVGEEATRYSERIDKAKASSEPNMGARLRFIAHESGTSLMIYAERLGSANAAYETIASQVQDSLEYVISKGEMADPESATALGEFLEVLRGVEGSASGARGSFVSLGETIEHIASAAIESRLTKGSKLVARELGRFVGNIDRTIAAVQRGIEVGEKRLAQLPKEASQA